MSQSKIYYTHILNNTYLGTWCIYWLAVVLGNDGDCNKFIISETLSEMYVRKNVKKYFNIYIIYSFVLI